MSERASVVTSERSRSERTLKRNWPLNCWWVAATTAEVNRKPLSRWLLERRVVLFRTQQGVPVALDDRCAHRWAPLSQGKLVGDEISCPYHGFRYNMRGQCTLVPSQSSVPAALRVHAYPTRDHAGYVWIWAGDPQRADLQLLPAIPWSTDAAFVRVDGYVEIGCNYMAVQENLLDFTHLAFLHADKVQIDSAPQEGWQELPVEVKQTERTVGVVLSHRDVPVGPIPAMTMGVAATKRINRRAEETFVSPACHVGGMIMEDPSPEPGGREQYRFPTLHCLTPISSSRCHYWWANAQDYGHEAPKEEFQAMCASVLEQDKQVLEAIQTTLAQDLRGDGAAEVSVRADRAPILARSIVKKMLEAEGTERG